MIMSKDERIGVMKKKIKQRLHDVTIHSYADPRVWEQPHRLHKRPAFSCSNHNCTVCRTDEKAHRKDMKEREQWFKPKG